MRGDGDGGRGRGGREAVREEGRQHGCWHAIRVCSSGCCCVHTPQLSFGVPAHFTEPDSRSAGCFPVGAFGGESVGAAARARIESGDTRTHACRRARMRSATARLHASSASSSQAPPSLAMGSASMAVNGARPGGRGSSLEDLDPHGEFTPPTPVGEDQGDPALPHPSRGIRGAALCVCTGGRSQLRCRRSSAVSSRIRPTIGRAAASSRRRSDVRGGPSARDGRRAGWVLCGSCGGRRVAHVGGGARPRVASGVCHTEAVGCGDMRLLVGPCEPG